MAWGAGHIPINSSAPQIWNTLPAQKFPKREEKPSVAQSLLDRER